MAEHRISRRAVVPGAVAGAAAALFGGLTGARPAAAAPGAGRTYQGGPCGLWREQTLTVSLFWPAATRGSSSQNGQFRLKLIDLDGTLIIDEPISLGPGTGFEVSLTALADGSVRIVDDLLPVTVPPGRPWLVTARLIEETRQPGPGQALSATLTTVRDGAGFGPGAVNAIVVIAELGAARR